MSFLLSVFVVVGVLLGAVDDDGEASFLVGEEGEEGGVGDLPDRENLGDAFPEVSTNLDLLLAVGDLSDVALVLGDDDEDDNDVFSQGDFLVVEGASAVSASLPAFLPVPRSPTLPLAALPLPLCAASAPLFAVPFTSPPF